MAETCAPNRADLVSNKQTRVLLWQLPSAAIVASFFLSSTPLKAGIWTAALTQMGLACLVNVSRCGRLHCYFTGPLFLLGALASLLRGLGVVPVTWAQLGITMLAGWLLLGRLPEKLWGTYTRRSQSVERFDQFTDRAHGVLQRAQQEAEDFSHHYIGTEHLLLGLIGEDQGVAAKVLSDRGVDLGAARSAVEHIVGRGDRPTSGSLGLTPRAKRVIQLSRDEARRLKHNDVGSEHLLLGLLRVGEGVAVGVLDSLGVSTDLRAMRDQISQLVSRN